MEVSISGRHVDVTDAMRDHARGRVEKMERYSPHITSVSVTLGIESDRHTAEVIAHVRRKGELVAKSETHDMYQSIDRAAAKLEKQLLRIEKKAKDHRETGRDKWAPPPPDTSEDEDEELDEFSEEE